LALKEWPPPLLKKYNQRYAEISAMEHIDVSKYGGAVAQTVRCELVLSILYNWLFEHGLIDDDGTTPPVFDKLAGLENALSRQYQSLGMTPLTARRIKGMASAKTITAYFAEVEDDETEVN
jgi:hypothetical protein